MDPGDGLHSEAGIRHRPMEPLIPRAHGNQGVRHRDSVSGLSETVVGIGTCSGADTDKFRKFGLTPAKAKAVKASLKQGPDHQENAVALLAGVGAFVGWTA